MARYRIVVSGKVQIAGYRAMVKNIAMGLGIKGVVRNLDDGRVEIFCEADKKTLDKFRQAINMKGDKKNIFAPSVNKIDIQADKSAKKQFKTFSIDYSGTDAQAETLERSEMGIVALGAVNSNIISMHTDLKAETVKTHEKLDKIANATITTHEKLDKIANATITTHEKLDKIANATVMSHEKLDGIDNRLGEVIEKYGEFGEKMSTLEVNMAKLTEQITRLVDHVVGSEK